MFRGTPCMFVRSCHSYYLTLRTNRTSGQLIYQTYKKMYFLIKKIAKNQKKKSKQKIKQKN